MASPNPLIYRINMILFFFPPILHSTLKMFSFLKNLGQFDGLLLILTVLQKGIQKQLLKSGSASTDNFVKQILKELAVSHSHSAGKLQTTGRKLILC